MDRASWVLEVDGPFGSITCYCVADSDEADEEMRATSLPTDLTLPPAGFSREGDGVVGFFKDAGGRAIGPVRLTELLP